MGPRTPDIRPQADIARRRGRIATAIISTGLAATVIAAALAARGESTHAEGHVVPGDAQPTISNTIGTTATTSAIELSKTTEVDSAELAKLMQQGKAAVHTTALMTQKLAAQVGAKPDSMAKLTYASKVEHPVRGGAAVESITVETEPTATGSRALIIRRTDRIDGTSEKWNMVVALSENSATAAAGQSPDQFVAFEADKIELSEELDPTSGVVTMVAIGPDGKPKVSTRTAQGDPSADQGNPTTDVPTPADEAIHTVQAQLNAFSEPIR